MPEENCNTFEEGRGVLYKERSCLIAFDIVPNITSPNLRTSCIIESINTIETGVIPTSCDSIGVPSSSGLILSHNLML